MKNTFKYTILSTLFVLFLLSIFSFKTTEEQKSLSGSTNKSISIPYDVCIFDSTVAFDRYDMRERLDQEILSFSYQHSRTLTSIKRANKYFPIIIPILKRNNIPEDFIYLAFIESGFEERAFSSSEAAGIWQFMPATARELGLEVNDKVDERYHIEKSTEAACIYFKKSFKKFNDWFIVAASYNAGMGNLNRRLRKQQSSSAFDLVLPKETSRYIFRLLAAKVILEDPQKYGFFLKKEDLYHSIGFTTVVIDTAINDIASFAKENGLTYLQLKDFNVWLRHYDLPNKKRKKYTIKIPNKNEMNFNINKVFIYQKNWIVNE